MNNTHQQVDHYDSRGYGAGGGGRNGDPYMAQQQPQPGQQQYQQSPRQQHNYPESLGGGGHGNMRHLPSASTLQVNHAAIASSSGIIIYNQKLIITFFAQKMLFLEVRLCFLLKKSLSIFLNVSMAFIYRA